MAQTKNSPTPADVKPADKPTTEKPADRADTAPVTEAVTPQPDELDSRPAPIESPDEQPALSSDTEFVDYTTDPADRQDTAKHLLEAAESIGADVEREVLTVDGGFRVSRRVADAAGL